MGYWFKKIFCKTSIFFFLISTAQAACEVIDDSNHKVQLAQPATRIISMAPDLTELLFAAGAGEKVVGVTRGTDYPAVAKKIPIIASYNSLNTEAVLALHPDLIIAWAGGNSAAQLQTLQHLGIPIFLSQQRDITDIPASLKKFGCLAGTEKTANQAAQNLSARIQVLKQHYAHQKIIPVFYTIGTHPLMTVNKDSWINQIISLCGGRNIFADAKGIAPQVSLEAVIAANPDVIITSETDKDWKKTWLAWPQLRAVQNHFLFAINPDWLEKAGPRLIDGAEDMCRDLQVVRRDL